LVKFFKATAISWSWIAGWELFSAIISRVVLERWIFVFTSLLSTFPDSATNSWSGLNLDLASFVSTALAASFGLESAFSPLVGTGFSTVFKADAWMANIVVLVPFVTVRLGDTIAEVTDVNVGTVAFPTDDAVKFVVAAVKWPLSAAFITLSN